MEGTFRNVILKENPVEHDLITAIKEVCRQIDVVNMRFEMESDHDLIESCIYEREALRARYRYLLRQAKEQGVKSGIKQ